MRQIRNSHYFLTDNDEVINIKTGRILKPNYIRDYAQYSLSIHGTRLVTFLHRIKLEMSEGVSKLHVNHIDGNPSNNDISNLEYVTHVENVNKGRAKKTNLPSYIYVYTSGMNNTYRYCRDAKTLYSSIHLDRVLDFKEKYEEDNTYTAPSKYIYKGVEFNNSFSRYTVNTDGTLYDNESLKNVVNRPKANGLIQYKLRNDNGVLKDVYAHRLVASTYLGLDLNKRTLVKHINGDKSDNRVENLKIITK